MFDLIDCIFGFVSGALLSLLPTSGKYRLWGLIIGFLIILVCTLCAGLAHVAVQWRS